MTTEVCQMCGGRGWLTYDVNPGHALFGKLKPCVCTLAGRRALLFSGQLADMTLANFKPLTADERKVKKVALALVEQWLRPDGARDSLVLWAGLQDTQQMFPGYTGALHVTGTGCGKTHLAVGLAKQALDAGLDVRFTTESDLLRAVRSSYGDRSETTEAEILAELGAPWLLVLDDVGTDQAKSVGWYQDILFAVVNARYMARLPLVLTSNLTTEQLAERLGQRTWSRLQGMAKMCRLDGPDRREMER